MSYIYSPIESLQRVLDLAKSAVVWSDMLVSARRIDESDTDTLKRVLRERVGIIQLLRDLGVPSDAFDHKYTYGPSPAELLREHLGLAKDAR